MATKILMTLVVVAALGLFTRRALQLVAMLALGKPDNRLDNVGARIGRELRVVFAQQKLLQWPFPGIMHFFIFWGFVILFTTIVEAFGKVYSSTFALPVVGHWGPLAALQDTFAALVLVGIAMAFFIRKVLRPGRFRGSHLQEADRILLAIAGIMLTVIGLRATEIALGRFPYPRSAAFLSSIVAAHLFDPLVPSAQHLWNAVFLWAHSLIVLAFLVYLGYSKHLHIITAPFNVFFSSTASRPRGALKKLDIDLDEMSEDAVIGAATITDLSWKQLLDTYTCTECGRCQSECPAWNTGKPLSPKLLVMELRDHLIKTGPGLVAAKRAGKTADGNGGTPLNPDVLDDEVIWDCTTCGACVYNCPVDIEHIDHIVDMRRNLVMMEARFPREMGGALTNLENSGNPWGQPARARLDWTEGLDVPVLGRDASPGDFDVLFWVGCAGAFEDRNRKVVRAFARLMKRAGVRFAILGAAEGCNGDPARRLGHEYLYQTMAKANIEIMDSYRTTRIVTACPHCFNTLSHEYPQFGGNYQVRHHTEYLAELVAEGRLPIERDFPESVAYHDPCYAARHNDILEAPRRILEEAGAPVKELHRHGRHTFCCGAGGGRMWMEERVGKKVNLDRVDEALAVGTDVIGVGCPFCHVMLGDGVAERGADGDVKVRDLAQILEDVIAEEAGAGT
ncbi:MAG TPA: (Fe-S)-binding protein [Actinomycetota bacterium]|nr:(Fe-S)-binding protein [Actinomycetota bacterium]